MLHPDFDPACFNLHPGQFDHQSQLHGLNHTYRVMCHCLILGELLQFERETRLAFAAAFIHDMSRKHDSYCTRHGKWAANKKLPLFVDFFQNQGINGDEIKEVATAVRNHSEDFDLKPKHPFRVTTSLLKDADALDRIRLGHENLNPEFLRFGVTRMLIPFATELYETTSTGIAASFMEIWNCATLIKAGMPIS